MQLGMHGYDICLHSRKQLITSVRGRAANVANVMLFLAMEHAVNLPYSRILHYWNDNEAAPANGGSGM